MNAYERGFKAGKDGKGMDSCPYPVTSTGDARRNWINGFDEGVWQRLQAAEGMAGHPPATPPEGGWPQETQASGGTVE